jgi:hypothetical protein
MSSNDLNFESEPSTGDGITPIFEVAYLGPALESGRIDLIVLSDALRGLGTLTERTSDLLYRRGSLYTAELASAPYQGSVVIPFEIVHHAIESIENVLVSRPVVALAALVTLLGLSPVKDAVSLFKFFKKYRGRAIDETEDLSSLQININVEVQQVIRIYNDQEVRSSIVRMLRPLREHGILSFETRRNGVAIETVTKRDLELADEAELTEMSGEEEKVLDIQKAALVRHLSWHFSDAGSTFDAQIDDDALWVRVTRGEKFGYGDRMRVVLKTTAKRDSTGRLRVERTIPTVLEVEHATNPQSQFWNEDPRI